MHLICILYIFQSLRAVGYSISNVLMFLAADPLGTGFLKIEICCKQ
jgi:hypothetical protein